MNRPEELVEAYARAVDARDWTALAELFTEDALLVTADPPRSLEPVVPARGRDAIVAMVQQVSSFDSTRHLVVDQVWTDDGTVATGRTAGEAHHVVEGDAPHSWVWHVEYADQCVLTDGGWRFTSRAVTVRMIERRTLG